MNNSMNLTSILLLRVFSYNETIYNFRQIYAQNAVTVFARNVIRKLDRSLVTSLVDSRAEKYDSFATIQQVEFILETY